MDNAAAKANQHATWKSVAPGWKKHDALLRRYTAPASERVIAALKPGDHVLDIASGTGEPAIAAAERVGPSGRVLGTAFVEERLASAREKAPAPGRKNVEARRGAGVMRD